MKSKPNLSMRGNTGAKQETAIEIRGLKKHYDGKVKAVDGISLEVYEGEVFAILGPNGAGKTTTISMLCGLIAPTAGSAKVAGLDVSKEPLKVRQAIGVVFQAPSVDDLLTGIENMELHALLYGMEQEGKKERIDFLLKLVELDDRKDSKIREYSGGMRKRLELVRGILHKPRILFLDEPTVGLDPQTRTHIWEYIRKLAKTENTTVVFSTHYLEEAEQFADRIAIIDHGRIVATGVPKALIESLEGDTVILRAKSVAAAKAVLEKSKQASNIKHLDDGKIQFTLKDSQLSLPVILNSIKGVDSIEIRPATLNDVFIKFTGRQIRQEEGEGGWAERAMNNR
ncbi:MAG: ATP-binding cassette domain-containing protein [Candidatus Micrarchaeia archaeon]